MPTNTKIPLAVILGLVLAIALDTIVQISWKFAVTSLPENAPVAVMGMGMLSDLFFYLVLLAFVAQYFNWMRVLARADLSFAQPITALSYITVLALSRLALHEKVSLSKILGIALIMLGVFLISQTPHRTIRTNLDP